AAEQAGPLVDALRRRGAEPLVVPTIAIADPPDGGAALQEAVAGVTAGRYAWVVLTSANGAERFLGALPDARALGGVQVAAIGPATAEAVRRFSIVPDLVPGEYVAESLLEAFPDPPAQGPARVLLARAARARDVLPEGLRARGREGDVVEAYRTVRPPVDEAQRQAVLAADVVTFTSSSTVDHYVEAMGSPATPPVVACIGPVTAETARRHGMRVAVEAAEYTVAGLVAALEAHFST